jgi:ribose transport system ATP-binding protein
MNGSASAVEPALSLEGISKAFAGQVALDDVSVSFPAGAITGLLGQNGCGKSTLIKVLAGIYEADAGAATVRGERIALGAHSAADLAALGIHFVHQDLALVDEMTVAENIGLTNGFPTGPIHRIRWDALRRETVELLAAFDLELDADREVGSLTSAEKALVAVARAFAQAPAGSGHEPILVLDEPTAALPGEQVEVLFEALRRMRARGACIVYVTHRLEEVFRLCDRVAVLRDGRVVHAGNVEETDEERLIATIVGRRLAAATAAPGRRRDSTDATLRAVGLSGRRVRGVDFEVDRGEVLGIAGLLGSGRSELCRLLAGAQRISGGHLELDGAKIERHDSRRAVRRGIAYVPEDRRREGVILPMPTRENFTLPRLGEFQAGPWIKRGRERSTVRREIVDLGIVPADPEAKVEVLSGGNQQKVVVGKWLRLQPRLLILDEPTQGVDVGAKAEIIKLIRDRAEAGLAVLFVSSEFAELATACDRVLVLSDGVISAEVGAGPELTEHHLNALCYQGAPTLARTADEEG